MQVVSLSSILSLVITLSLVNCSSDDPPTTGNTQAQSPAAQEVCDGFCARQLEIPCPQSSDAATCSAKCKEDIGASGACETQTRAIYACGATASWTCDANGEPSTNTCSSAFSAYEKCARENK